MLWASVALAQTEVCASPFELADWRLLVQEAEEALDRLDGAAAEGELSALDHELRCTSQVVPPALVGRVAVIEAVVAFHQGDVDLALAWALTAREFFGPDIAWPAPAPQHFRDQVRSLPDPAWGGPQARVLDPPDGGAILRNGLLLTEARVPVGVPALMQVADKRGRVLRSFWQDGSAFPSELLIEQRASVTPPRWYQPPGATGTGPTAAPPREEKLRFDRYDECPWAKPPKRVVAKASQVLINRRAFPTKTPEEQRSFVSALRACGEHRAARRFLRWRDARSDLSPQARALRAAFEEALLTPEPDRTTP